MLRTGNHTDEKTRTILNLENQGRFRVLCVDHHAVAREGISVLVNCQPDMSIVAQASNGREAIECFRKQRPDVTLMDLMLPDMCGIDAIVAIRQNFRKPESSF